MPLEKDRVNQLESNPTEKSAELKTLFTAKEEELDWQQYVEKFKAHSPSPGLSCFVYILQFPQLNVLRGKTLTENL